MPKEAVWVKTVPIAIAEGFTGGKSNRYVLACACAKLFLHSNRLATRILTMESRHFGRT